MRQCEGYPHRNIIEYVDVFGRKQGHDSQGVVVMELAAGGALSGLLYDRISADSSGRVSGTRTAEGDMFLQDELEAKRLYSQIAAGIQWLANCGVMHKDLKP